jgi:hypothetical protein
MAIEDAAILSRCLAEFDEPNDVYRWYEASVTPSAFQSKIAGCADQPTPIGFIATIPVWRRSVGPHRVRGVPTMMEPKPDDFPRSAQRCGHSSAFGCRKVDAATEQSARP